jgi:transketolase
MRRVLDKFLVQKAYEDPSVIVIVGDIGYGVFDKFKEYFPKRFINLGVMEQSMVGIAAGMALAGKKPYVYTITPFLIERAFEQIKIDIVCNNAPVVLIGYADYPEQGITHQELDGERLMSLLSIYSYFPMSLQETEQALIDSYGKPSFISLKKKPNDRNT